MTLHPSNSTLFENLQPADIIDGEALEFFTRNVLQDVGRICAYAIIGYADWLHYICVRYLESGGQSDLSHIEKSITWPDDIDYDTKKRVVDNVYMITRPIILDAQYYKKIPEPRFDVGAAIDWMTEHMPKEKLDKICEVTSKAMMIMESGLRKNQPFTDKLVGKLKGQKE